MAGLAELAAVMMTGAQQRIDVTAGNIGNVNTPGFRSRRVFAQLLDLRSGLPTGAAGVATAEATSLKVTGNPMDLAADKASVFQVRDAQGLHAARSVHLRRDSDGHLVDGQGRFLQASGGGDVIIGVGDPTITRSGVVFVDGQPQARVGLFRADGDGVLDANDTGQVMQGQLVPSDVDMTTEMTELTRAGRYAETGAKVFQIYDDLLGRASSMLGSLAR